MTALAIAFGVVGLAWAAVYGLVVREALRLHREQAAEETRSSELPRALMGRVERLETLALRVDDIGAAAARHESRITQLENPRGLAPIAGVRRP